MDQKTLDSYNQNASTLVSEYNSVKSPIFTLLAHFFRPGERLLDVGSGTGRDMAALFKAGYQVMGLEPSTVFIQEAQSKYPNLKGQILQGHLPDGLENLGEERFEGVILSAVLMHISQEEFFSTALKLKGLLVLGGRLVICHCTQRPDLVNQRDRLDRLYILRNTDEVRLMFERLGLEQISQSSEDDALGRQDIHWVTHIFQWTGENRSESIDRIETIINNDRKTATYKLALLRALCDLAQLSPHLAQWRSDGTVSVPIWVLSEKWIEYYLPLVDCEDFLPQIRGETRGSSKPIAFRSQLQALANRGDYHGPQGMAQYLLDRDRSQFPDTLEIVYKDVRKKIGNTIINGPIQYTSGDAFFYEKLSDSLIMEGALWRELMLLGHWIRDSLILRWADLIRQFSGGTVQLATALTQLMQEPEASRRVNKARLVYQNLSELNCVWSNQPIPKNRPANLHIDHAIPFSLRHDNSLWNLLPSIGTVNLAKRDKLPGARLLVRQKDLIIHYWRALYHQETQLFQMEATRLKGRPLEGTKNWELPLFLAFQEAVESTAVLRGVERWEGS